MALYIGIKNLIGKGAAWLRSKWSTIVTQLLATFRYRVAGGADNVLLPERNSRAVIDTIYGNTVKWNQLLDWLSISALGRWSGSAAFSFSKSGTKLIATCKTAGVFSYYTPLPLIPTGHKVYSAIDLANSTDVSDFRIRLGRSGSGSSTNMGTITATMSRYSCIGSINNNTDTGNTYFILESSTSTPIEVGNITQFDNWIVQDLTDIFGSDAEIAAALGISVADITTSVGVAAFENWLALNVGAQDYYPYDAGSLVSFKGQGVRTIKNNVELDRMTLDVTKIYGKVNGQGSHVQCFPNGVRKVSDTVYDTLSANTATKVVLDTDLGDWNWAYTNAVSGWVLQANLPNVKSQYVAISSIYPYKGAYYNITDKAFGYVYNTQLIVKDSSYPPSTTTAAQFKAAMTGVKVLYQRSSPITYTDLIYSEDGGVTGTPLSEFKYRVDKYSTEELLVPASVAGEPTSTAIVADIEYQAR